MLRRRALVKYQAKRKVACEISVEETDEDVPLKKVFTKTMNTSSVSKRSKDDQLPNTKNQKRMSNVTSS